MSVIPMLAIGFLVGIFSGVFGVGGGVILVPILVLLFGYSQIAATGTSLVALLLPVGALGVYEYHRSGRLDYSNIRMGLIIAVGLFFGAFFGAKVAASLPEQVLRRSFAAFLVVIAGKLWWS